MKVTSEKYSKTDTRVIVKVLKNIEAKNGVIRPVDVVKYATDAKSPIHSFFEWDDTKAAGHWRLHQARVMIASISVKSQTTDQPVRAFVNVTIPGNESEEAEWDRGYVSIEKSMESTPLQEQVMSYAKQQLVIWRRKFGAYEQFYGVASEIDKIVD